MIDSSKIKVPVFWGEALTPSGKNLCGCLVFFTGLSKGTLNFVLELIWKEKFRNLRRNTDIIQQVASVHHKRQGNWFESARIERKNRSILTFMMAKAQINYTTKTPLYPNR